MDVGGSVGLGWGGEGGGSIVGEEIGGNESIELKGLLGKNIVKLFDYRFGSVGVKGNEVKEFEYKMVEVSEGGEGNY